jgi:flagellar hook-associated protein 3 FlgL
MIDSRAGGAQLKALDNAADMREANGVTLKTTLSQMRDLDYADALSQYQLQSTALQAAQTIFSQMQSMSLFNKLR